LIAARVHRKALLIAALLALAGIAAASPPVRHTVDVDGFTLTVWEKSERTPRASILLVHGRTWSSLPNFDLQVAGNAGAKLSIMDALAERGYAVYALDQRGYGATPRDASGWLTPQRAAADVAGVLRWIARRPGPRTVPALLGYSRGAHVCLLAAQQYPDTLSSLVLFALPSIEVAASTATSGEPPRRATTRAAAAEDFITPGAASRETIDAYADQAVAADSIRVDWRDEQQFIFDPGKITPTLMLYGANDPLLDAAKLSFFGALATHDRSFVVLPDSDHAAHVENSQPAWLRSVDAFVGMPRTAAR
jgi:pimeloyl-ACP methyl ester carboxylesterase